MREKLNEWKSEYLTNRESLNNNKNDILKLSSEAKPEVEELLAHYKSLEEILESCVKTIDGETTNEDTLNFEDIFKLLDAKNTRFLEIQKQVSSLIQETTAKQYLSGFETTLLSLRKNTQSSNEKKQDNAIQRVGPA